MLVAITPSGYKHLQRTEAKLEKAALSSEGGGTESGEGFLWEDGAFAFMDSRNLKAIHLVQDFFVLRLLDWEGGGVMTQEELLTHMISGDDALGGMTFPIGKEGHSNIEVIKEIPQVLKRIQDKGYIEFSGGYESDLGRIPSEKYLEEIMEGTSPTRGKEFKAPKEDLGSWDQKERRTPEEVQELVELDRMRTKYRDT